MVAYEPPANASPIVQTFAAYINALGAFDSEGISANLDDEAFEFNVLPQAMATVKWKKQEYVAHLQETVFVTLNGGLSMTVHEIIEADNALAVYLQTDGMSKLGTPFNNEYVFMVRFVPSKMPGELPKIGMCKVFGNSAFSRDFRAEEEKKKEAK
ncbi:uncharacterized protein EV420DRAFT_1473346 [Desarmillaria tabescens]|uniref:NTF2 domain-containing protein n=1 Tax=Armillaria tabescens TaxID=1929756 RepID=A0AA39TYS2_ARMTA|nr:uncharacterized protein EV420DRAFT_1473346 [Desarmillaria tabescens]KAK0470278.1 hypothetical protein EV420DRAFT_1473346 [Desarmillaria tabescens]